eukprot:UN23853
MLIFSKKFCITFQLKCNFVIGMEHATSVPYRGVCFS